MLRNWQVMQLAIGAGELLRAGLARAGFGASTEIVVLAFGCLSEFRQLPEGLLLLGYVCVGVGFVIAGLCIPVALYYQRDFAEWARAAIAAGRKDVSGKASENPAAGA